LRWAAPAKLNLFLHIIGRRADGYHQLQTVFQLLDWCDWLEIEINDSGFISLSGDLSGVRAEQNLVWRAASLLQQHAGVRCGAHIRIEKHIPDGAGLGGGSSDAATTLLVLNQLWGTGFSVAQIADLGLQLGADVPVFVHGNSAWAEGLGEKLTPLALPRRGYVLLKPPVSIATANLFADPELTRDCKPTTIAGFREQGPTTNVFEALVRKQHPEVDDLLSALAAKAEPAEVARLTGTGSCVFLPCSTIKQAQLVLDSIRAEFRTLEFHGIATSGIQRSVLHSQLEELHFK